MPIANAAGLWLTDLTNAQTLIDAGIAAALGNAFVNFSGPASTIKTFTLPNASCTILTTNTAVTIAQGGTGAATALAAFNALSPVTTRGDLITRDATNNVRLPIGAATTVLISNGTDPVWGQVNLTTQVTGVLPFANGGNGLLNQTTTPVDVTNTDAETTVYTFTVPGGSLSTNQYLEYIGEFKVTSLLTPPSITIKAKYGAAVVTVAALAILASITDVPFTLKVKVYAIGATNVQKIVCELLEGGVVVADTTATILKAGAGSEDSTADKAFAITIEPDATVADTSVLMEKSSLYLRR